MGMLIVMVHEAQGRRPGLEWVLCHRVEIRVWLSEGFRMKDLKRHALSGADCTLAES